jgi:hypothetical protein
MSHAPHIPYTANPAHVANVATQMARAAPQEWMAFVYSGVAIGCMVMMGAAAGLHVYKEFTRREERQANRAHARAPG